MKKIIPQDAVLIPDQAERVFSGVIFDVYQWQQENFDGSEVVFEMLKRADTVEAIPITDQGIMTILDTQPHLGSKVGFPGGRVDKEDSSTLQAIQREILEETGYEFKNWRLIRVIQPHPKLEWFVYTYVTWDGSKVSEPHLDAGEKIELRILPFQKVKQLSTNKSSYLTNAQDFFKGASSIEELLQTPEFVGEAVDR